MIAEDTKHLSILYANRPVKCITSCLGLVQLSRGLCSLALAPGAGEGLATVIMLVGQVIGGVLLTISALFCLNKIKFNLDDFISPFKGHNGKLKFFFTFFTPLFIVGSFRVFCMLSSPLLCVALIGATILSDKIQQHYDCIMESAGVNT